MVESRSHEGISESSGRDEGYIPVKASSGKTRRSRFRSRDSSLRNKLSACAMLAGTSPSVGVNCSVAILMVVVGWESRTEILSQAFQASPTSLSRH